MIVLEARKVRNTNENTLYNSANLDDLTVSIILFADGASFNKNTSAWAMFGIIADLHPIIRNSYKNIITFYMLGTSKPLLNKFSSKYMKTLENILNDGIKLSNLGTVNIKIVGFIGDSQAIPKALNTKQYNGTFGCIHCVTEGVQINKTLRVYPFGPTMKLRTSSIYQSQVSISKIFKREFEGIKGKCWLSKFIEIPNMVILDYMHICCIGTMQKQLSLWNLSNYF